MTDLPRDLLPGSLLQIAEYCGEETMWAIWRAYGGGHLSVPLQAAPEHGLSQVLGYPKACQFCLMFGGELLTIPKAESARRTVRNERIREDRRQGMDNFSLCRKYDLTERQISAICQGAGANDDVPVRNLDLFD